MTKSQTVNITITAPAPPALGRLELTALEQSVLLGGTVNFQVLALDTSGLALPNASFSILVNGTIVTSGTTGPSGTAKATAQFNQYGNYTVYAASGSIQSNQVFFSIPVPPPPPTTPTPSPTSTTLYGGGYTILVTPALSASFVMGEALTIEVTGIGPSTLNLSNLTSIAVALVRGDGTRFGVVVVSTTTTADGITLACLLPPLGQVNFGSYGLEVILQSGYSKYMNVQVLDLVAADSPYGAAANSPGAIVVAVTGFDITIPQPVMTLADGGVVSSGSGVDTHAIDVGVTLPDGTPVPGMKVTLVDTGTLSSLGSGTTDSSGRTIIDVTLQVGRVVSLVGFWPQYPPLSGYPGVVSAPLSVAF